LDDGSFKTHVFIRGRGLVTYFGAVGKRGGGVLQSNKIR
jgi:hypothetical protein